MSLYAYGDCNILISMKILFNQFQGSYWATIFVTFFENNMDAIKHV